MENFVEKRLSERLDNLSDEFWAHYDESSEKREKKFCEDASDIASILVDLLNDIAEILMA